MRKNFTKAVAAILSVCVTMTSVSWENFIDPAPRKLPPLRLPARILPARILPALPHVPPYCPLPADSYPLNFRCFPPDSHRFREERPESNRFTFEFRLAGLTMRKDPVGGGFTF